MEKVVCALWGPEGEPRAAFGERLVRDLPAALFAAGATGLRLNIRDARVASAAGLNQCWQSPQQDAVVQFWLPSANAMFRQPVDDVLAHHSARFEAWLVAESTIIPNREHPPRSGEPCVGWAQASFISFPQDMPRADAIAHWHDHHTKVAIDTQSNFEYIQNIIVKPLTANAPTYDAFVEECFPDAAQTDPRALYDAIGDEARYARHLAAMIDSVNAFLDMGRADIIPTSQFNFTDPE
jgi:hypothetical protein